MLPATRMMAVGVAAAFLLSLPAVAAETLEPGIHNPRESTPTTLYMHIDGIQDFPINTQLPDDRYQKGQQYGLTTSSLSCTRMLGVPGIPPLVSNSYHTYYGYSTPGYVQYDFEEDGGPRYHKERGLSFDVLLDTSQPMTVSWFLETHATSADLNDPDPNTLPVFIPEVVVRATMREGDKVGLGSGPYNEGNLIAVGQTEPAFMSPESVEDHPHMSYSEVGGKHVYRFDVPLEFQQDRIPRDESYNIRVDVFMDNPFCDDPQYPDDAYLMPNNIRVHTSPNHRPQMELSVFNPLRIEYLHPQFIGDDLVIHTSINSPWGNYDVNEREGGIVLRIDGPTPATSLYQAAFVQRHHEHHHHQEPVDVTWIWPYRDDRAANGLYTVVLEATNDQESAKAIAVGQFEIGTGRVIGCGGVDGANEDCVAEQQRNGGGGGSEESPGVGILAVLAVLGGLLVALRRRRQQQ